MDGLAGKNSAEYWKSGSSIAESKSIAYNIVKEKGKN
jgi:hypothetical protein